MKLIKLALVAFVLFAIQYNSLEAKEKKMQITSVKSSEQFKKEFANKLYNFLFDVVLPRMAQTDPVAKKNLEKKKSGQSNFTAYYKTFVEDKYIVNFISAYLKYVKLDDKGKIWTGNIANKMLQSGDYRLNNKIEVNAEITKIKNGNEDLRVPLMNLIGVFKKDEKNKKKDIFTGRLRMPLDALIDPLINDLGQGMTKTEQESFATILRGLRAELEVTYSISN